MNHLDISVAPAEVSSCQRETILATLQAVLESPHFCKSKRYPSFLEYVVQNALDENAHGLKERTVGVEVFGRPANYDTSTDPVVRVAAGEVRRRMAAYFSEHPEAPVRIEIPAGSYHAEFCFQPINKVDSQPTLTPSSAPTPDTAENPAVDEVEIVPAAVKATETVAAPTSRTKSTASTWITWPRLAVAALVVIGVAAAGLCRIQQQHARQDFWWPVVGEGQSALILVGQSGPTGQAAAGPSAPSSTTTISPSELNVALDDAIVTAQICSTFREYKVPCKVEPAIAAKLGDTVGKSVVLVGGLNNPWTGRLLAALPYHMQIDPDTLPWAQRVRTVLEHKPGGDVELGRVINSVNTPSEITKDYAIIGRFHSDMTDGTVVVIAGVGRPGTSSAGQYITSPAKLQEVLSLAPKDWAGTNFEAVLEVDVVQGSSGHTRVLAARFW